MGFWNLIVERARLDWVLLTRFWYVWLAIIILDVIYVWWRVKKEF